MPNDDLSFDPRDPYFPVPGDGPPHWAVQVFTTTNGYGLDPAETRLIAHDDRQVRLRANGLTWFGQQHRVDSGSVEVDVHRDGAVYTWSMRVRHREPVKAVKLRLAGLPEQALRSGWWTPNTSRGTAYGVNLQRFQLDYPGPGWATPWIAAGERDAVVLGVRDSLVRRKILHVYQPPYASGPVAELVHVPSAVHRSTTCTVPPIRLRLGADAAAVDADLDDHLAFLESAYGLAPWERRADVPAWLTGTALVVTLHGQHWTGYVFNTFERMERALRFVARHIDPARVLAYLPGWEGRYYYVYPQYWPGADLGGPDGFGRLVRSAQQLGFRVMPMFGAHGANVRQYPEWQQAVLRNDTDRYVELLNRPDWDSDRSGEGDQVFLNPGQARFRKHLVESISAVVQEFGVDAAFLDTAGYWVNDPRFELMDGYRVLAHELRQRHPGLLLACEGWWDALTAVFPLSQQWLGVARDLRKPRVLTRYARTTTHLAGGTPGLGSTGVHEQGFLPRPPDVPLPGHIPVVGFVDDTLEAHANEVAQICQWATQHPPDGRSW